MYVQFQRCPEDEDKDSEEDESLGEGDGSNEAEVDIGEVKGKIKGGKSAAEKLRKESRSEQQRLLREQRFNLPYHVPETKPLKDFLTRVPVLKTSKDKKKGGKTGGTATEPLVIGGGVEDGAHRTLTEQNRKMNQLFLQKPTLASSGKETVIEFEDTSLEFEDASPPICKQGNSKKKGVLDSFMARFEKHTRKPRKSCESKSPGAAKVVAVIDVTNDIETAKEDDKTPGGRRLALKEVTREQIHRERCEVRTSSHSLNVSRY